MNPRQWKLKRHLQRVRQSYINKLWYEPVGAIPWPTALKILRRLKIEISNTEAMNSS